MSVQFEGGFAATVGDALLLREFNSAKWVFVYIRHGEGPAAMKADLEAHQKLTLNIARRVNPLENALVRVETNAREVCAADYAEEVGL